jgi:hypothetical protein
MSGKQIVGAHVCPSEVHRPAGGAETRKGTV